MSTPASGAIGFNQIRNEYLTTSGSMNQYNIMSGKGTKSSLYYNINIPKTNLLFLYDGKNPQSYNGSTTWYDVSGGSRNATSTGGVTANGSGYTFDGSTGYFNGPSVSLGSEGTYVNFVYQTANQSKPTSFAFRDSASAKFNGMNAGSRISASLPIMVWDPTTSWHTANSANSINVYKMYAWTWTAGNSLTFYNNGSADGTASIASFTNTSLTIGYANVSATVEYYTGNVYIILYYNRALSASEISGIFGAYRGRFGI